MCTGAAVPGIDCVRHSDRRRAPDLVLPVSGAAPAAVTVVGVVGGAGDVDAVGAVGSLVARMRTADMRVGCSAGRLFSLSPDTIHKVSPSEEKARSRTTGSLTSGKRSIAVSTCDAGGDSTSRARRR